MADIVMRLDKAENDLEAVTRHTHALERLIEVRTNIGMMQQNPDGSSKSTTVGVNEVLEDLLKYLGIKPFAVPESIKFNKVE